MSYLRSSVGTKQVMAITGLLLVGFAFAHLAGNLAMFFGPEAMNAYAYKLKSMPVVLWGARAGLLTIAFLHIYCAVRLVLQNKAARPQKYKVYKPVRSSVWARMMPYSGLWLFGFIIFHLLHFTGGKVQPEYFTTEVVNGIERHDAYNMVVHGFQSPAISIVYLVSLFLLCLHLLHGIRSLFQSTGFNHPKYRPMVDKAGPALAVILFLGFSSIPIAVLAGIIKLA